MSTGLTAPGRASDAASSCARVVCARVARFVFFAPVRVWRSRVYPLPPFSRRRKEGPTPVLRSEWRRGRSRGGYSSLPREAALGELSGCAVVEAVVRVGAHRDQVPAAPAPAGEVFDRIDMMRNRRFLTPAVPQRLLAQRLLTQDAGPQGLPSFACVIHGKIKNAGPPSMGDSAACRPAIT